MPLDNLDKNAQRRVPMYHPKAKSFFWNSPYLFRLGIDGVEKMCTERREARDLDKVSLGGIQGRLWEFLNTSKGVVQRILLGGDARRL
jgi:hypothetical protein